MAEAAVGACLQVPDYDIGRLITDVVYRGNSVNLDTTDLPVPGIVTAITPG